MNKSMIIHETILKDILDTFDDIKDIASKSKLSDIGVKADNKNPMRGMSSIAKATSNMTLVFPVICSRSISIENASMVTKAIEKNAVSMMQRLLAAYNIADEQNVTSYIQKFHNNISSTAASLDDVFRLMESSEMITATDKAAIMNDMRNINYYLPNSISESGLTSFTIHEGAATRNSIKDVYENDKTRAEYFNKQVLDGDYKKANELMPTMMTVNFKVKDDNGNIVNYDNALVGIKAKLYPIVSDDIIKHIADKTADNNWITNFFRATTREISFIKDFVLALDKAKIDAMSLSTRKSTSDKMWKVLERRATNSRLKRSMFSNNSAAAITTLCISQEEVEFIRKNHNIDLERISNIIGLFESLNLMCICIVDESLEVAKFIYDTREPMWETISFTHLERESSDNTYKRVVNLMTKMSR